MVVRIHTNKRSGGASAFPAAAPFAPVPTAQDGADRQLDIALGRADRARAQSASALAFENILAESADQAPDDGSGISDAVNIRLDQHIRDALEVYTDHGEREAMMDLLEGQAEPVRSRARDRQIEVRSGHLRRKVAGVTDDWAASARMNPAEAPMIAMRAAAAVHAVADNDDARVISAHRIGDLVQATERKVLSAALSSLVEQNPDQVPALLTDPDGPYRQAFPEDHFEDARAEAEVRVRARSAETLARLERAIDEGAAGALELKQAAREDWLDEGAQARIQGRLETRAAKARAGRERIMRVAGLVADGGSLDSSILEDREAADVYYESVVAPGLEALNPAERIGEAAGFAARMGVLPKDARRQIRGGLAASEPVLRARAADAVVRISEAAPELTQDFDPGLRTEAFLIASLVDSGVTPDRAVEMAGDALARNSTADRAERERRITEENHGAENDRFLVAREDDIAEWFAGRGGLTGIILELRDSFGEKTRTVFLRTGDLAASQNIALADLRRKGLPEGREQAPGETMEFRPGRDGLSDQGETKEIIPEADERLEGADGDDEEDEIAMGAAREAAKKLLRSEPARRLGREIRRMFNKPGREGRGARKKLTTDPKPIDPDKVAEAFRTALDAVNAARAAKNLKPKKVAEFTPDDLGTDDVGAIQGFVESHLDETLLPAPDHTARLNLGKVDTEFATRLKADTGYDVSGLVHTFDTDQLGHALGRHGRGSEKDADQEPISPEALSIYRRAVETYDRVEQRINKEGMISFLFEKDIDGVIMVVEQMRTGKKRLEKGQSGEFSFISMWIKKR